MHYDSRPLGHTKIESTVRYPGIEVDDALSWATFSSTIAAWRRQSASIATRIEAELVFAMKKQLAGPRCTTFDVLNATDFVVLPLEIPKYPDRARRLADQGNADGGNALGARVQPPARSRDRF